jgi:predicted nucleotide-binding protein (sugar kinase/HSP70/actin superfamily)
MPLKIGLPRALLYHRYAVLWNTFFDELGVERIVSPPTNKEILDRGAARAIDEACLSLKIYFGHVDYLTGKCDYILTPRICGWGIEREMCTRFESLYDLSCNVFRDTGQKFISYNIDPKAKQDEEEAFRQMGLELGFTRKEIKNAYKRAKKAESESYKKKLKQQESKLGQNKRKILVAAHSYVIEDAYIGKVIIDYLEQAGAEVIRADIVDRKNALKKSVSLSSTMKWEMSREIAGGIQMYRDKVDGIILISAFSCGPDSMVNEMIIRKVKNVPILNLTVDAQEGTAGVETRLESFLDIIAFKESK